MRYLGLFCWLLGLIYPYVIEAQGFSLADEVREQQKRHSQLRGPKRYESALELGLMIERLEENAHQLGQSGLVAAYYEEALKLAQHERKGEWALKALDAHLNYASKCKDLERVEQLHQRFDSLYRQHRNPTILFGLRRAERILALLKRDTVRFEQKAREVIEIARRARLHPHEAEARLEWANYLKQKKQLAQSLYQVKEALALKESRNDIEGLNVHYEELAELYDALGHPDSADQAMSRYFESALRSNDRELTAGVTLRIGNRYASIGKLREAIPYFLISQALLDSLRLAHKREGNARMMQNAIDAAVVRGNLSAVYRDLNLPDSCAYWIHRAQYVAHTVGFKDVDFFFHFQLANIYLEQDRPDSALARADSAINNLKPYEKGRGMELAYTNAYTLRGHLRNRYWGGDLGRADLQTALNYFYILRQAVSEERKVLLVNRRRILKLLANELHAMGWMEPALAVLEYYTELVELFRKQAASSSQKELLANYELKARDRKIELLALEANLEAEHQRRLSLYLIAGGVLLLLALVFIWGWVRRYRERRRENQRLAEENLQIEQQNNELEIANQELRAILEHLREQQRLLTLRQQHIDQSLRYAQIIQEQFLGNRSRLSDWVGEHMLYYEPRDVVSGDLYWWRLRGAQLHLAAIDCTGHGVPGALMSILAYHLMEEWIEYRPENSPAECLSFLDESIRRALKQDRDTAALDGMDLAYLQLDLATGRVRFAGARRPLWLRRNGSWHPIEGARRSVGGRLDNQTTFETRSLLLRPGDRLFLFTDGLTDQFGGPHRRKLGLEALLAELSAYDHIPLAEAEGRLISFVTSWRGSFARLDDALLVGLEFYKRRTDLAPTQSQLQAASRIASANTDLP